MMKPFTLSSLCRHTLYPLLGLLMGLLWLLGTETGLKTSWIVLRPFIPGNLSIDRLQGRWLGNIALEGLVYRLPKNGPIDKVSIQHIDIRLSPWAFLEHKVRVEQLELIGAEIAWTKKNHHASIPPLILQHVKLSADLSLSSWSALAVKLSKFSGKNAYHKFWGQADFSIKEGTPYLGIVQLRYGEQSWGFIPKPVPRHAQKSAPISVAGTLYWRNTNQSPLFQADILQTIHPKSHTLKWQLPAFPLRALSFALPDTIKWDSEVSLSIQYHPPARKKPGHVTSMALFPHGIVLLRDTPYSWLKCSYEKLKLSTSITSFDQWSLDIALGGVKAYLPTQGIAIQEGELQAHYAHIPHHSAAFSAIGKVRMGQEWLHINSKAPDTWVFTGQDLLLYHTYALTAVASPDIILQYKAPTLHIQGNLAVSKAKIQLKEQVNQSVLSRDVRFVDRLDEKGNIKTKKNNALHILPDIQLSLKNVTLQGYGLEGKLEGNLSVAKRHDGVLTGQGELWIDKGRYRLQGRTRNINKGRLYFPSGTLLSDPLLDIRITERNPMQQESAQESNFYIQGTLTRPIIQLYNPRQKNAQLFSSTNDNPNAQTLLASQSALFLADAAGNNSSFIDRLQNRLHVEDISVESRHTTYNPKTHSDMDTVLTVGSYLTPQVYLQYLKSMLEDATTVKLKYFLGKHWAIGVETGTEGSGSDISFSIDTD